MLDPLRYPTFTSAHVLFELLCLRYSIPAPADATKVSGLYFIGEFFLFPLISAGLARKSSHPSAEARAPLPGPVDRSKPRGFPGQSTPPISRKSKLEHPLNDVLFQEMTNAVKKFCMTTVAADHPKVSDKLLARLVQFTSRKVH